jgi:hypothetical protein
MHHSISPGRNISFVVNATTKTIPGPMAVVPPPEREHASPRADYEGSGVMKPSRESFREGMDGSP